MSIEKLARQFQSRGSRIGVHHTIATEAANDNQSQKPIAESARELTRKLNRRGCKLRVKRRRGDSNRVYAEKQLAEVERRLRHAWEHINRLQLLAIDCEQDLHRS
jgi:hypothetical protein